MRNAFYGQSGGVTSVINATAQGVIEGVRESEHIDILYAGRNGILGLLKEDLIDTSCFNSELVERIGCTPGGVFGSCRFKLPDFDENPSYYRRLIDVMSAYDIGYFFYNGGGDSQDTAKKISDASQHMGYALQCVGVPKTIDNDLPMTHCSPGFGSVARYVAVSTLEASLDVMSMCSSSTKVFIMEVMGRHAGWIAASSAMAAQSEGCPPHIILFPERVFDQKKWLEHVKAVVSDVGFCVVVVSEGIRDHLGHFVGESNVLDAFGHAQLGGVAPKLAAMVQGELGFKTHWSVPDYLQRSARHYASKLDYEKAYLLGKSAVALALEGYTGVVPILKYADGVWKITHTDLSSVANVEKNLPDHFIDATGFGITKECRAYLSVFFEGEDALPNYVWPEFNSVSKRCGVFKV